MFATLSNSRRFHVVSFVLAAVCFAAMSLFCQNAVMGQEASGEETAVAADADVGENNSGGEEKGTEKKGEESQIDAQENVLWRFMGFIKKYKHLIIILSFILSFFFFVKLCLRAWALCPSQRMKTIRKKIIDISTFKTIVLECLRLRYSKKSRRDSDNSNEFDFKNEDQEISKDFIYKKKVEKIVTDVLNNHGEKITTQSSLSEKIYEWVWPTTVPLTKDDAYLIIIACDLYSEEKFKNEFESHKNTVCDIYEKRYSVFWRQRFWDILKWVFLIVLLPDLLRIITKLPDFAVACLKFLNDFNLL